MSVVTPSRARPRQQNLARPGPRMASRRGRRGRRLRVLLLALLLLAAGVAALLSYTAQLPDPAGTRAAVQARLSAWGGTYAPLQEIPRALRQAFVAAEDDSFYSNPGISPEALARAFAYNVQTHSMAEGGSTITQQLVKVVYLDGSDRTARRKLDDILLALRMNRTLSKDTVLELYSNAIYYGHGAYGVAQAAATYFHRPVARLDLAQCALLAGLVRAPSLLDPLVSPHRARARRATVLDQMAQHHMITPAQASASTREPLLP